MATELTADAIADMVVATRDKEKKFVWTDLIHDLQEFHAVPQILKSHKVKFAGGRGWKETVMTGHSGSAKNVGLFQENTYDVQDVLTTVRAPIRFTNANYSFDLREEDLNSGDEQIVDIIKVRHSDAMASMAERIETDFWGKPSDSDDVTTPWGIYMWLVRNASEGFYGGNPAGFSDGAGGLSSVTQEKWRNWTGTYSAVSKTDLIRKMGTAYDHIHFKSPIDLPQNQRGADNYSIYVNYTTKQLLEEMGEARNENHGSELQNYAGKMTFRGNSIKWAPFLDSDTTNPVLFINWAVFFPFFLRNWYMRLHKPTVGDPRQPNVIRCNIDLCYNFFCKNRRRLAILYQV